MYAPATPLSAAPLVPVGITATTPADATGAPAVPPPVDTELHVHGFQLNVIADHRASVTGALLADHRPAPADQLVLLQALGRHGWRTLASAHTRAGGQFRLRYLPRHIGSRLVRVRFAGSSTELASKRRVGRLNVHRRGDATSTIASAFVRCVTEHESSLDWHIVDPPYSGGDQWTVSTWQAAGGWRFAPTAAQATPAQQVRIFEEYEPSHPGAWPVTVPACS